jgi:oxygen-independent coproporphyrinogen-3 oxidase
MDELTWKLLGEAGYEHYEISNYASPESVCRHNLKYWHCEEYLGVGTGAASYMKTTSSGDYCRLKVITDTKAFSEIDWNDQSSLDKCFMECDILSLQEQMEEMAFLGLRTKEGVRLPSFYERFGKSFNEVYGEVVKKYTAMGMMKADETHVALTLKGMEVANWIMADFCG